MQPLKAEQPQIGTALVCKQGYCVLQVGIWIWGQADKMERAVEKVEQALDFLVHECLTIWVLLRELMPSFLGGH